MTVRSLSIGILAALLSMNAGAAKAPPAETPDGLLLVPDAKIGVVYRAEGVDFSGYTEIGLVPCSVSFKKNWMRDKNRESINLADRVTQRDVDRIKDKLAAECDKSFRSALLEDPAYKLVDSFMKGEPVLIVIPAIINLDVTAPDIQSAGNSRSYTTSAGQMTLVLELQDGTTGAVLLRAYDAEAARDAGMMQWANSVTNRAEADRILNLWSSSFRRGLDAALKH